MPVKASSKWLVIDASIARAAGGAQATFPTSKHCRDFLQAVLQTPHRVVMTEEISAEWNKHQSRFARAWRVSMVAGKRMIFEVDITASDALRRRIEKTASTPNERNAMRKDFHLIEAATATDKSVASLDETVRALFHSAANTVIELRKVMWINPDRTEEESIRWLKNGAKHERKRALGYVARTI